jgi:hypothetical protein
MGVDIVSQLVVLPGGLPPGAGGQHHGGLGDLLQRADEEGPLYARKLRADLLGQHGLARTRVARGQQQHLALRRQAVEALQQFAYHQRGLADPPLIGVAGHQVAGQRALRIPEKRPVGGEVHHDRVRGAGILALQLVQGRKHLLEPGSLRIGQDLHAVEVALLAAGQHRTKVPGIRHRVPQSRPAVVGEPVDAHQQCQPLGLQRPLHLGGGQPRNRLEPALLAGLRQAGDQGQKPGQCQKPGSAHLASSSPDTCKVTTS